jgi:hypothetical protein
MVYDEETGNLITLGEYQKRALCRFVGMTNEEGTKEEGTNGKRKAAEGDDIERKEKRIKVEADN